MAAKPDSSPSPTPAARRVDGRIVLAGAVIGLLALMYFTYYVVPGFVTPYFRDKPAQTQEIFATLERALLAYAADHEGSLPPEEYMLQHRRVNKNLLRSRALGIATYRVSALTTPVSYFDQETVWDPYAVPEQYAPPAYVRVELEDGQQAAILSSPGPNLIYEIRPWHLRQAAGMEEIREILTPLGYDPTNGTRSGGDYWHVVVVE